MKKHLALIPVLVLAIAVPSAFAWPGRPATRPPKPPNPGAPPPAWIETQAKSAWLAYGSYCWRTACVDMIPPDTRPDLPAFRVTRGRTLRVHLGFTANAVGASVEGTAIRTKLDVTRRILSWRAMRGGILTISARSAGSASYVARLRVT